MSDTFIQVENYKMFLVAGYSGSGKTASLHKIRNQNKWIYYGCESNKGVPFKHNFNNIPISDPYNLLKHLYKTIQEEEEGKIEPYEGIIIDSIDFLMNQYERLYCYKSKDSRQGWQDYNQFFKELFQEALVEWAKPVIVMGHLQTDMRDELNILLTHVPAKGSLKNDLIESYFNQVVYTKKITIPELKPYEKDNNLLHISERERNVGIKYVFQTLPTKLDHNNTIRGPMDLFSDNETFIDNDCQLILDKLEEYYGD